VLPHLTSGCDRRGRTRHHNAAQRHNGNAGGALLGFSFLLEIRLSAPSKTSCIAACFAQWYRRRRRNKKIVRTGGVIFLRFQNWRRGRTGVPYANFPDHRTDLAFVFQNAGLPGLARAAIAAGSTAHQSTRHKADTLRQSSNVRFRG